MSNITSVTISDLFGCFDHTIPLKREGRSTVIKGPNGVGKTTILRLLRNLFAHSGEFEHLFRSISNSDSD